MRTTGSQALLEVLRGEGVEYVFGIPGATEIRFMDALERASDIHYVLGLHEVVCAGMAEGYARATGRPGFLNLHTASGVAAATPMLYNAFLGGVPLVVTCGQNDTRLLQHDPHLSGDIVAIAKPHTKWATEITHAQDIPLVLQRAFKMALQPPTGPVLVSIPQNVLAQELDFDYKRNTQVFARIRPDRAALDRAVEILEGANNPLIMVESGVSRADALTEVIAFAEIIGARVFQSWMADVNFPVTHPQYLGDLDPTGPRAVQMFADTDVLVGIGCSMFAEGFLIPEASVPQDVKIIHIDDNPWELGKNLPTDCAMQGDIRVTLKELNAALAADLPTEARERASERARRIAEEKSASDAEFYARLEAGQLGLPIRIPRLMTEIDKCVGPGTVVVDECWSASAVLRRTLRLTKPRSFFRSRKGGSIGWGLPGALGVKLGMPDKDVLAIVGDGGAGWSMQSLWTAARYEIPVTYVITNNATYGQVKLVRAAVLGPYPLSEKHVGMELDYPVIDFTMLAQAMGVVAQKVAHPDEFGDALQDAIASGEPRLVEVLVEQPG
ncbi:MAG: thiamine pyrophosphate-binding protein [Actinobacteria bacterium]|nr:thiamine pyrophosphate-binding protein [Actinomycetota bacterium]